MQLFLGVRRPFAGAPWLSSFLRMSAPALAPGFIALHSHRAERLAELLTGWLQARPLAPLETEVVLVQSNGMAEWFKIELARRGGVCAAARVELPSRFLWRTYRQVLGAQQVPAESPLDKLPLSWRLMALLPECLPLPVFEPVRRYAQAAEGALDAAERVWPLASALADLFDQYQIYRPDWLQDWAEGRDVLRQVQSEAPLPEDQRWQAELWRRVLATLAPHEREATRPALHARALARLRSGTPASPVARRVSVFGMGHMPWQLLELLSALAGHSQVLLAVPNPCQHHWADILDGREWLQAERRRHAYKGAPLAQVPLEAMHLHAPALLAAWGRQGRDFIRQLDAFDDLQAAQQLTQWPRLDFFEDAPGTEPARLLTQLQQRIRDLVPAHEAPRPLAPDDRSVQFTIAHSAVRELEVLHDQLLQWFHETALAPREVVVMVPDIARMAPAIRAVFGQYPRGDARHIPFDIADLGAEATSPLLHALQWLLQLPQQRARLSELVELLEVPAVAARIGLQAEDLPTLARWMGGAGIRWGLSAAHRDGLGLGLCGEDNTALFGLQRMLMGYACGADPLPLQALGIAPYAEVGGLDAELAGALAQLVQSLLDWWSVAGTPATPAQWAERGRGLLAALFAPADEAERRVLQALHDALNAWLAACEGAGFDQAVPLPVARSAWLAALQTPRLEQRFRSGGVTFCTLMPMRAIPFQAVCLLGMNDGDYPRRAPRLGFDLMGLAGMARPGDRARRDDDRQLMLEALMSARQRLYVSWSGRSVRDHSMQPPSVLVAQLRDEIDQLWGRGTAERLSTEHPLQPFSPRYFAPATPPAPRLQTYAHEWQATARAAPGGPDAPDALHPSQQPLPPPDAAQGLPQRTLAQWQAFVRRPVAAFFSQRLGVDLRQERSEWPDEERFGLGGLDLYGLLDEALQQRPAELSTEAWQAHVQRTLQRLRLSGELPLAGVGELEAARLGQEMQALLARALHELQAWPHAAPHHDIEVAHPALRLQDSLQGLRQRDAHPLTQEAGAHTAWVVLRASRLAHVTPSGQVRPAPEKLIGVWLTQLAANATGLPMWAVVVGRNAVLRSPPQAREAAQAQLQTLLGVWAEGMCWPLPLPPAIALQWLRKPQAGQALTDLYEGDGFGTAGVAAEDPALQRCYPTLAALMAGGHLERLAPQVFAPLLDWAERLQAEAVAPGEEAAT